ncbi:MAG: hypothetical protein ACAH88_17520, partial [Roseimicrobium sp.]
MPPKEVTGALIHVDEFKDEGIKKAHGRFVLAKFKGFREEPQTGSALYETTLFVLRNKFNTSGKAEARAYPARVIRRDASTGIMLVHYADEFPYEEDEGLKVERAGLPSENLIRVATAAEREEGPGESLSLTSRFVNDDESRQKGRKVRIWPKIQPEVGVVTTAATARKIAVFQSAKGNIVAEGSLVISKSGGLAGFVNDEGVGDISIHGLGSFDLGIKLPQLTPLRVTFNDRATSGTVEFQLSKGDLQIEGAAIRKTQGAASLLTQTKALSEKWYEPISGGRTGGLDPLKEDEKIALRISALSALKTGESSSMVLQGAIGFNGHPLMYTKPVHVDLKRGDRGIEMTTEGLPDPASAPPSAPGLAALPSRQLVLEADAKDLIPVNEGKEVLIPLKGPPYWKRLSVNNPQWLALPEVNLAACKLAGNKDALFVLDRTAGTLRRYGLQDLKLEAETKLPPGSSPVDVVAGSCTSTAPIHVLMPQGVLSLSPTDLRPTVISIGRRPDTQSTEAMKFSAENVHGASGDGFSLKAQGGAMLSYEGATTGMRSGFMGKLRWVHGMQCGVSGAFYSPSTSYFAEVPEMPKEKPLPEHNTGPNRRLIIRGLSSNAPVSFQWKLTDRSVVPPKPPLLACLALFEQTPLIEFEAPEFLASTFTTRDNEQDRLEYRWASLDPYSLNLLTLGAEYRTLTLR